MTDETLYIGLSLVTFLVALRAALALIRVELMYRRRNGISVVLDRQRRWAWALGLASIAVGVLAGWALLRYAAPQFNLGGLPPPLTTVVVIVVVNLAMLWLVNLERTWRHIVSGR